MSADAGPKRNAEAATVRFAFRRLPVRAKLLLLLSAVLIASCLAIATFAESTLRERMNAEVALGFDAVAALVDAGAPISPGMHVGPYTIAPADGPREAALLYREVTAQSGQHWVITRPAHVVPVILRELRVALVLGGSSAIAALILILIVATGYFTRRLERLVQRARHLDTHQEEAAASTPETDAAGDEIEVLSGSFDRLEGDLRRALRKLAKERDRFRTTLFNMDEAVFSLKHDGRVRLANRAALALLRREEQDVIDVPITELLSHEALSELLAKRASLPVGSVATMEFALQGPMKREILARFTPHQETRGSSLALVDVTNMRRLETLRQDFVANVSHELRTPVAVLAANIETLLDGALDDKERSRHFLDAMQRNVDRLTRLVGDLLDLARIESGAFEPALEPVRISDVVGAVADGLEGLLEKRNTQVSLVLEENILVRAASGGLEQILVNLVENAVKYSPDGVEVEIAARVIREGWAEISVADNGPGIDEVHRERLFERFYRVDPGRSKEMGGTGLGLAIVKHLTGAFGGSVAVKANTPRGAVFTVELPLWDETSVAPT